MKKLAILFAYLLTFPLSSSASMVSYYAEASIDYINTYDFINNNGHNNHIHTGDFQAFLGKTIRVGFSYEDDILLNVNQSTQDDRAKYNIASISVSIDGTQYANGSGYLYISDSIFNGGRETYWIDGLLTGTNTIGGLPVMAQEQSIFNTGEDEADLTSTYINDKSLPSTLPEPSLFDSSSLRLRFYDEASGLYGDVWGKDISTFVNVAPVPIPPSIILFLSSIFIFPVLNKYKQQNNRAATS